MPTGLMHSTAYPFFSDFLSVSPADLCPSVFTLTVQANLGQL